MDSNRDEHPLDADESVEDVKPKPRRKASDGVGIEPTKRRSSRNTPSLAGRGTDTGIIPAGRTLYFDLEFNIAAALCYFPLSGLASILWLATEKGESNQFLKFHAVQSLVITVALVAINVLCGTVEAVLGVIPVVGPMVAFLLMLVQALVGLLFLGLCVSSAVSVYKGKDLKLPVVASLSERIAESYF